jgi:hypothetical protein
MINNHQRGNVISGKIRQAIAPVKAGDKPAALPLLKEVLQADPQNEKAWLWLYSCLVRYDGQISMIQFAGAGSPDPHQTPDENSPVDDN